MLKDLNSNSLLKEKILVALFAAIQFAHILDFVVIMPLGPVLMRHFEISPSQFALLVSSYNISAALLGLALGTIADRFDRKLLLQISFFLFALATVFCAFAENYNILLATRILAGAFGGALNTLVFSLVTDLIPFERRGKAMGTVLTSFSITSVIGIPIGLSISDHIGWRYCFLFIALFSVLIILIGHFILPKVAVKEGKLKFIDSFKELFKVAINFDYIRAYGLLMALAFSGFLLFPFLSPYAVQNVGIKEEELKYIYFYGGLLTVFTGRISGRLTDLFGSLKVFIPSIFIAIPLILLYTQVENIKLEVLLIISSLFMAAMTFRVIPAMTLISAIPVKDERGAFMSVLNSLRSLSSALATLFAGFLISESVDKKLVNFDKVGYISAGISLLTILMIINLYKIHRKRCEKHS